MSTLRVMQSGSEFCGVSTKFVNQMELSKPGVKAELAFALKSDRENAKFNINITYTVKTVPESHHQEAR